MEQKTYEEQQYEIIMSRVDAKPCTPYHKISSYKVEGVDLERLPEPAPGYEWWYTEDTMPLSGCSFCIQLNHELKVTGEMAGFCIH